MTLEEFKDHVKTGRGLDTEEIHQFMDEMSDAARQIMQHITPRRKCVRFFRNCSVTRYLHRCVSFHHSTRISVRTSLSGRMSLSMPAAIFRIMAALSLATDVR